jgi:glycosyltransferase involved in cell wall biosynthesis
VPAYRHEAFVAQAVESVLGQTMGDFELVVIDDCSPDGTWDVIQGFRDERLHAMRHTENLGAVKTLNEGLRQARGKYLTILNSDDAYAPRRLEVLVAAAERGEGEFFATDVELVEGADHVMRGKGHGWIEWFEGLKDAYRGARDPLTAVLAGNIAVSTSNMFFTAGVPRRIGYFYEYRYAHDYEFLLRYLADAGARFRFMDGQRLLYYRLHEANTITESRRAVSQEVFGLLARWLAEFAPLSDRTRMSAIARHMLRVEGEIEGEWHREARVGWEESARLRSLLAEADSRVAALQVDLDRCRDEGGAARAEAGHCAAALELARQHAGRQAAELAALQASQSFRLGRALLQPARWGRRWLGRS